MTFTEKVISTITVAATAVAMATSVTVMAAEPNWFVTASVGQSSAKAQKPNVAEVDTVSWDDSDTSYSLGGGYHYADFDFILSYEQLGEASASYTGEVIDSELFHQALVNSAPKLVDGISLQGRYTLWQSKAFNVKVGVGLLAWELDYTSQLNESIIKVDESDTNLFYNLQVGYKLTKHVEVSLQATRYTLSVNDVDNIDVGITYYF